MIQNKESYKDNITGKYDTCVENYSGEIKDTNVCTTIDFKPQRTGKIPVG